MPEYSICPKCHKALCKCGQPKPKLGFTVYTSTATLLFCAHCGRGFKTAAALTQHVQQICVDEDIKY
jgi:uncharacterized protein with PIN domain